MEFVGIIRGGLDVESIGLDFAQAAYDAEVCGAVVRMNHSNPNFGDFMRDIDPTQWIFVVRRK